MQLTPVANDILSPAWQQLLQQNSLYWKWHLVKKTFRVSSDKGFSSLLWVWRHVNGDGLAREAAYLLQLQKALSCALFFSWCLRFWFLTTLLLQLLDSQTWCFQVSDFGIIVSKSVLTDTSRKFRLVSSLCCALLMSLLDRRTTRFETIHNPLGSYSSFTYGVDNSKCLVKWLIIRWLLGMYPRGYVQIAVYWTNNEKRVIVQASWWKSTISSFTLRLGVF